MATYTEKLEGLYQQMRLDIINKVREIGKDSKVGFKSIKLIQEIEENISTDYFISEIGEDNFFDKNGYQFNYSVLDFEELCHLVDYINTLK